MKFTSLELASTNSQLSSSAMDVWKAPGMSVLNFLSWQSHALTLGVVLPTVFRNDARLDLRNKSVWDFLGYTTRP